MQNKDQIHPDDKRNLFLFAVLSILLWLSYDHFILKPKMEKMRAAQEIVEKNIQENRVQSGMAEEEERPRAEIIAEGARVSIKNDKVFGTLNLTGARLDDLELQDYFKTVERKENVSLLSPAGSKHPQYIEHGWVSSNKNLKMPETKTRWKKVEGDILSPNNPVTLRWNNGQGLVFEQVILLDKEYGFKVVRRVINNTGKVVELFPYSLVVQRGVPEDFLGSPRVHEGPIGYFDDEVTEARYGKMDKEPQITKTAKNGWIGLTSKAWLSALVPEQHQATKYRITYTKATRPKVKDRYQSDFMGPALSVSAGSMGQYETNFYTGAKKLSLLERYEKKWSIPHFDLAIDFGWYYFLTRPFLAIINFFYGFVGNFGVAIILFTVVLRICIFPLANTSFKSFAKMRKIGPQMGDLKEKYADDKQKLQQELVKLYQKEKVNPMAGCLPIVVQIPIFFSLFKVLSNTIEMRQAPFFGWIQDLSAPDPTSIFNLFGLIDWDPPRLMMIGVWPCLMLITMIIQRKLSPPPTDKFQARMIAAMPWLMTYVLAQFASGLVIYWTFNNLFSSIQQYIIMTRMGVKVDLLGNLLGKNKEETPIEGVHAESALVEEEIEEALGIDQEDTPENSLKKEKKKISKPKPKKSKKKK